MPYKSSIETVRHEAITAAKDLQYNPKFIKEIKHAQTEGEVNRIMANARKEKFGG